MSFEQRFIFNGVDLSELILVTDIKRQIMPRRRLNQVQVPGLNGCLVSAKELEPVELVVKGCILRHSMQEVTEARKTLANALYTDKPAPLYLPDDSGTYLMALYEGGAEPSALMSVPDVELSFLVPDPVAFGETRSLKLTKVLQESTYTGGTYPARPVFTIKPHPSKKYVVAQNRETGEFVRVDALNTFSGEETIVIDCEQRRCTINGHDHPVTLESDYFSLFGQVDLFAANATGTVEWQERWL